MNKLFILILLVLKLEFPRLRTGSIPWLLMPRRLAPPAAATVILTKQDKLVLVSHAEGIQLCVEKSKKEKYIFMFSRLNLAWQWWKCIRTRTRTRTLELEIFLALDVHLVRCSCPVRPRLDVPPRKLLLKGRDRCWKVKLTNFDCLQTNPQNC